MIKHFIVGLCAILVVCSGDESDIINKIDAFVEEAMAFHNVPGLTLAIVHNGSIFLTRGYGVTDLDSGSPVTNETLFYVASTGKAMTSMMLAELMAEDDEEEGERPGVTLDTPVQELVGDVFQVADGYRRSMFSLRDLLSHRTGVPTAEYHHFFAVPETREELLERARFFNPIEPLRNQMTYSNVWYTWAGHVAELYKNEPYEDLMRRYLFEKLDMAETRFFHEIDEADLGLMATPYYWELLTGELRKVDWAAYAGAELVAPSGGIVSNAIDLAQWLLFQTAEGLYPLPDNRTTNPAWEETRRIATRSYFDYFVDPSDLKPFNPVSFAEDSYGLGWFLGYYRGYRLMNHLGAFFGFWAQSTILPDMDIGVYVVGNGPNGTQCGQALSKIVQYTMDLLLGEEPWLNATTPLREEINIEESIFSTNWELDDNLEQIQAVREEDILIEKCMDDAHQNTKACTDLISKRTANAKTSPKYAGTYGSWCCGNVTISYNSTTNILSGLYGRLGNFRLLPRPAKMDTFLLEFRDPFWFVPPVTEMIFYGRDGGETYDELVVPFLLPQDPPVFVRDRMYEDAPPIVDDCDYH